MPPKKDSKKDAPAKPDNSGIPKLDVEFKFSFTITSDSPQPPAYALMFQWFGALSDKFQRNQSISLQAWKREENRYTFEKQCDAIRVDDDFCKNISSKKFCIYFVNTQDSKVEDKLLLDYSCLLMTKQGSPKFTYQSNTIKVLGIDAFSMTLTADKPLLEEVYRHYLNPLQIEVVGAKNLPIQKSSKYEATYVRYQFYDGSVGQTHALVGSDQLLWSHKHVLLVGLMNAVELKQKMRSRYLKFQLHDRDQINNKKIKADVEVFDIGKAIQEELQKQKPVDDDPKKKGGKKQQKKQVKKDTKKDPKKKDAKLGEPILPPQNQILKSNYGISACNLIQFLKPSMRAAKYKVPVVPKNTFEDFQSKNIDLNTTARNQMQKVIASNNYFDCDTVLVVGFSLAYPIGTFVKPQAKEQPVAEDPKKKKEAKEAVPVKKAQAQAVDQKPKDVFERVVYIIPYKDAQWVKKIQDIFYEINLKAFNLTSRRQITTHLLSAADQNSLTLDYVTGLQIADPQGRIYIIQGLKQGSMKEFHKQIVKTAHNKKDFKIFKNSKISFTNRLFKCFNIDLKRIRLRPTLNQLLLQPSLYIKSKVPEQICQNLNKLADIRKVCDDLTTIDSMNLWPNADWLIQIQRKFSQSLSYQDVTGVQKSPKKVRTAQIGQSRKAIKLMENTDLKVVTADQFFLPKINQAQNTIASIPAFAQTGKRTVLTKTFTKDQAKLTATYTMRGKSVEVPAGEQVYIYGGQRNNFYEKKKRQLREELQKHPNAILTYSKDYLGLSIDPHNLYDESMKQKELNLSKMYSKDKFSSLIIRTKQERMRLANKPTNQDITQMINNPYHEQKERQKQMKKNYRDMPPQGKDDFKKYIRPQEIFSQYQPVQGEQISPAQKQLRQRQERKRAHQQQKQKYIGDLQMKIKKGYHGGVAYGADRFKDIREGQSKKIGIIDVSKKTKQKRPVHDLQVSYNLKEVVFDPSFNPLIRRDDPSLNIQKDQFNFYQRPQILTKTNIFKPLKDIIP